MKPLRIVSKVSRKILESVKYLEEVAGMGEEFTYELAWLMDQIRDYPERYPMKLGSGIRGAKIPRFRYILLYAVRPEEIVVVGLYGPGENWTIESEGVAFL